jgi:hypothetical protein
MCPSGNSTPDMYTMRDCERAMQSPVRHCLAMSQYSITATWHESPLVCLPIQLDLMIFTALCNGSDMRMHASGSWSRSIGSRCTVQHSADSNGLDHGHLHAAAAHEQARLVYTGDQPGQGSPRRPRIARPSQNGASSCLKRNATKSRSPCELPDVAGLIVSSALMLWKVLILVTGSESPVRLPHCWSSAAYTLLRHMQHVAQASDYKCTRARMAAVVLHPPPSSTALHDLPPRAFSMPLVRPLMQVHEACAIAAESGFIGGFNANRKTCDHGKGRAP